MPYATLPPLWFEYGWSTKSSCVALAGQRLRPVRAVADDPRVAVPVGVVDHELVAGGVVRSEREPEQALLAAGLGQRAHVEERLRLDLPRLDDADEAALLDDVDDATRAAGRRHLDRAREPGGERHEAQRRRLSRRRGGARNDDEGERENDGGDDGAAHSVRR